MPRTSNFTVETKGHQNYYSMSSDDSTEVIYTIEGESLIIYRNSYSLGKEGGVDKVNRETFKLTLDNGEAMLLKQVLGTLPRNTELEEMNTEDQPEIRRGRLLE